MHRLARWGLAGLVAQLVVAAGLTSAGVGVADPAQVMPPMMEKLGPSVTLQGIYAEVRRESHAVVTEHGKTVATAAFAGIPTDWMDPRLLPSEKSTGLSLLKTLLSQSTQASKYQALFIVPLQAFESGTVRVRLGDGDHEYALSLLDADGRAGYAVAVAEVSEATLGELRTGLRWLTQPPTKPVTTGWLVVRADPTRDDEGGYTLTTGVLAAGYQSGMLHAPVAPKGLGTPVVAYVPNDEPGLVGFVESPSRGDASVIPTARVAGLLHDVATTFVPVQAGTPLLGLKLKTSAIAELEDHRVRTGHGAVVTGIVKGSPAETAGLTVGDEVTKFDNVTVEEASQVIARVRSGAPGSLHLITVRHADGRSNTVEIRLTAHV